MCVNDIVCCERSIVRLVLVNLRCPGIKTFEKIDSIVKLPNDLEMMLLDSRIAILVLQTCSQHAFAVTALLVDDPVMSDILDVSSQEDESQGRVHFLGQQDFIHRGFFVGWDQCVIRRV